MTIEIGDRFSEAGSDQRVWVVRSVLEDRCELQSTQRWNLRIFETPARLLNREFYTRETLAMATNFEGGPVAANRIILKPELSDFTRGEILEQIRQDALGSVEIEEGEGPTAVHLLEFTDYELVSDRFGWAVSHKASDMDEDLV